VKRTALIPHKELISLCWSICFLFLLSLAFSCGSPQKNETSIEPHGGSENDEAGIEKKGTGLPASMDTHSVHGSDSRTADKSPENAAPVPVIIIPGIAGSELAERGGGGGLEILWPPAGSSSDEDESITDLGGLLSLVDSSLIRLERLSLSPALQKGAIVPLRCSSASPSPSGRVGTGDIYKPLYEALETAKGKGDVYFFGYDWRQDNNLTAAGLDRYIDDVLSRSGAVKVDLVAHSMGGLVASSYLTRPGAKQKIRKIVMAGSPLAGSAEAFRSLDPNRHGQSIVGNPSLFRGDLGHLNPSPDSGPGQISQALELEMRRLISGYPSIYELLTTQDFSQLSELGLPQEAVSPEAAVKAISLARVYNERIAVRLPEIWRNVDVCFLTGVGHQTLDSAGGYTDGDGTVSLKSAIGGGVFADRSIKIQMDHVGLIRSTEAIRQIIDYLN